MNIAPQAWVRRWIANWWFRQGLANMRRAAYPRAIAHFSKALPHHSDPTHVLVMRGLVHWRNEQISQAITDFDAAIARNPTCAKAYGNRGLMRYQHGDEVGALADWALALHYRPGYAEASYNRALLHANQHRYVEALADFDRALTANPNLADAYLHRGNVRQELGDRLGAIKDWELALINDLSLEPARKRLLAARKESRDLHLAQTLQTALKTDDLTIEAHVHGNDIDIIIHRALGAAVNYFKMANQLRHHLQSLKINGIRHFRMIGRVGDRGYPEWEQSYRLYDENPCPPSYWGLAILATTALFPPLGIVALVYAAQVKRHYRNGELSAAERASKTAKQLSLVSAGIFGLIVSVGVVYVMLNPVNHWMLEQGPPVRTRGWLFRR
ncbi:tetratricopeptide repeat protein [Leptolyngbya sp. AN02str]|uniref:tetratricopeptide repeat protein n=1 Tax=Leptolyngbya sp. AN02str TaxID=3423363 RepID=UPI003D30FD85